jgi:hypothetical protein
MISSPNGTRPLLEPEQLRELSRAFADAGALEELTQRWSFDS